MKMKAPPTRARPFESFKMPGACPILLVVLLLLLPAATTGLAPPSSRLVSRGRRPVRGFAANTPPPRDYLVTDSLDVLDADRPSLAAAVANPRDGLAMALLAVGLGVSGMNVAGNYGERYVALEQLAVALGVLSGAAAILQLATGYMITDSRRRGIADDGLVTLYGGLYSLSVSWLALRASDTRSGLWEFDSLLSAAAVGCFLFGIAAPLATLCWPRANEEEGKEGGAGGLSSSSGGDGGGGWQAPAG